MHSKPANENNVVVPLIKGSQRGRTPMNTATTIKSVEENVQTLNTVCHVVEVKDAYALVHASPNALAQIIGSLGFTVSPSKRGGDYYAVRVGAAQAARPVQTAPVARLSVAPAPVAAPAAPKAAPRFGQSFQMEIKGDDYSCCETQPKRRQDARRWEIQKAGASDTNVVTFQDEAGTQAQCSCKDWIYRRHTRPNPDCKHCTAFKVAFARRAAVA